MNALGRRTDGVWHDCWSARKTPDPYVEYDRLLTPRDSKRPMPPFPPAEAARLRREAETASPDRRAYLLWLAQEWDKAGVRPASPPS